MATFIELVGGPCDGEQYTLREPLMREFRVPLKTVTRALQWTDTDSPVDVGEMPQATYVRRKYTIYYDYRKD